MYKQKASLTDNLTRKFREYLLGNPVPLSELKACTIGKGKKAEPRAKCIFHHPCCCFTTPFIPLPPQSLMPIYRAFSTVISSAAASSHHRYLHNFEFFVGSCKRRKLSCTCWYFPRRAPKKCPGFLFSRIPNFYLQREEKALFACDLPPLGCSDTRKKEAKLLDGGTFRPFYFSRCCAMSTGRFSSSFSPSFSASLGNCDKGLFTSLRARPPRWQLLQQQRWRQGFYGEMHFLSSFFPLR